MFNICIHHKEDRYMFLDVKMQTNVKFAIFLEINKIATYL